MELAIPGNIFAISRNVEVRAEISESLLKRASSVKALYSRTKGRKRSDLESQTKRFHLFEGQVLSVTELQEESKLLRDELNEWKRKYSNLKEELGRLHREMMEETKKQNKVIEDQQKTNEELVKYIKELENVHKVGVLENKGKDIGDVKKKSRTLKTFMSRAQTALWFSKSFGLELESLVVTETKTGTVHVLGNMDSSSSTPADCTGSRFDSLCDADKAKVEQTLFLLDKYGVGDSFFHELSMSNTAGLTRSYLIKQRRDDLNRMCHVVATPGKAEGAQLSFNSILLERLEDFIETNPDFDYDNQTIKIKLSGDGARMTRNTSFIILSFALLQGADDVMSARGNHTIAVVKSSEKYATLKESFQDVFKEINYLNERKISVKGRDCNVELFLGGDYKFILIMLGLKGATSHYACAWCKVHKDSRYDMQFDLNHYNTEPMQRTLQKIIRMAGTKKDNYCCEHAPLLFIDLDHVILDELHLMLRVTDVLINNLLEDVLEWDKKDDLGKKKSGKRGLHMEKFINTVRSCGISFDVWEKQNADGKGSGMYDYTSLLGNDKKKLMKELPDKLEGIIHPDTSQTVIAIWKEFRELYGTITNISPSDENIAAYFDNAVSWTNHFISLRGQRKGYKRANVTPYMHAMVYHVPIFFQKFKSVKVFTGQGVEKNNDFARNTVLNKSNKWNAAGDVLRMEARQWALRSYERKKRQYTKTNKTYWEHGLLEARRKKRKACSATSQELGDT